MLVNEIFFSVQGEGKCLGTSAIFLRLSGCNKTCSFCDSKHSWFEGKEMSITEVIKEVKQYNCHHLVITGGEPLLQQNELIDLMEHLLNKYPFFYFECETNGSIKPKQRLMELMNLFTVSPKFEESFKYSKVFSEMENHGQRAQVVFKFVIDKQEDINQVLNFNAKYNYLGYTVYLMPCGTTREEINSRFPMLFEIVKKSELCHLFRVTDRLQIQAYGDKRGT
jgi:organic radical activating enzyme